jgi:hypothetical protein
MREAARRVDLPALHEAARELEDPERSGPRVDELHGAVGMALIAEDGEEAAWALAGVVESCGGCHAASTPPVVVGGPRPPHSSHGQAGEGMWSALLSDDGAAFSASLEDYLRLQPEHDIQTAHAARKAASISERADAWGELLVECQACHAR